MVITFEMSSFLLNIHVDDDQWWVIDDIYAEDPTSDANSEDEDLQTHLIGNYEVICIDWYPALTNDETNEAELANPNQEILAWYRVFFFSIYYQLGIDNLYSITNEGSDHLLFQLTTAGRWKTW